LLRRTLDSGRRDSLPGLTPKWGVGRGSEIVQGERFFGAITETHSQPGNIERVARRGADATCVDSVTYAFFCRHRPQLGALTRVLAATPPSPGAVSPTAIPRYRASIAL